MRKVAATMSRSARYEEDYSRVHGDTSWGLLTKFFLLWTTGPICVRLVMVWLNTPVQDTLFGWLSTVAGRAATAIPQDLLVTAQAFLFCFVLKILFTNKWCGRTGCIVASLLATTLFTLVQLYILCDFLVFYKTGVRMDLSCFLGLSQISGLESLRALYGLLPLLLGFATIGVLAIFAFQFFYDALPEFSLSYRNLFWLMLSVGTGIASTWFVSSEMGYFANNPAVQDEVHWLIAAIHNARDLPIATDDQTVTLVKSLQQVENSAPIAADYPLLKKTHSFSGEKQFDVRVDADEHPHVIFLELASFRAANVGVLGSRVPASPNFDRLAQDGILFTDFYANSVRPPRADLASLFGILPQFVPREVQVANPRLSLIGLPDILHRSGYQNAFIYGSSLDFDNLGNFARHHGFDVVRGGDDLRNEYPQAARSSWGIHDEYLFHYVANWLERQDQKHHPSFMFLRTTTNRQPWQTPPAYKSPHFDVPAGGEYAHFLSTFSYSDACLGMFVKLLAEKGLDKKTILVVYGDEGMPMGEHFENYSATNYLYEENLHVPLLILAPGRIEKPIILNSVASQIDLLPTMMDLLHLTGDNHAMGTSLVRQASDRTAFFQNPFAMQYIGMRQGNWKYTFCVRTHTSQLIDLSEDPDETNNLAAQNPAIVQRLHAQSVGLNQWMTHNYWHESFTPRDLTEPKSAVTPLKTAAVH